MQCVDPVKPSARSGGSVSYIDPGAKLLGHLDRLALIKAGQPSPPINVEIDLSNRCSLGCEWCHFAYTHTRGPLAGHAEKPVGATSGGDLMPLALARRIISELEEYGVRSIAWTGGGEPTLHPNFDEIISATRIDQGIYTHGGHIDMARAILMKRHMTWCYISLDCADRETYRREKRTDFFERACQGVRNLVAAPGKATIGVGFLLTKDNWKDGPRMIELGRSLGADYIQFRPAIHFSQEHPQIAGEDTSWMTPLIAWLSSLSEPDVEVDANRFAMYRDWSTHEYSKCWWSALSTVITPNGKVWMCVNKREHADAEIGDLSRDSFAAIWNEHKPCTVARDCRVMCRGHIANRTLNTLIGSRPHGNFI